MDTTSSSTPRRREPWNKGKLVGQKAPFKPKEIWAMRMRLQRERRSRNLVLLNPAWTANCERATWCR